MEQSKCKPKAFTVFLDTYEHLQLLDMKQRGELFTALYEYAIYDKLNFPTSKQPRIPEEMRDKRDKNTDQVRNLLVIEHAVSGGLCEGVVQQYNKCLRIGDVPQLIGYEEKQFTAGSVVFGDSVFVR